MPITRSIAVLIIPLALSRLDVRRCRLRRFDHGRRPCDD